MPSRPTVTNCDAFTADLPEAEWLCEGWFETESLISVFGPSGHGKTFICMDWALSIASGREWQGCKVRKGVVVYCAAEGARGAKRRAAGWMKHHDITSVRDMHFYAGAPQLRDDNDFEYFLEQVKPLNPDLVVVDTLATTIGGDENSSEHMGHYISQLKKLQRLLNKGKASVLVVHHVPLSSGKGGQPLRERGHSSYRASVDTSIAVEAKGAAFKLSQIKIEAVKQKDDVELTTYVATEKVVLKTAGETTSGKPMTTLVVVPNTKPILTEAPFSQLAEDLWSVIKRLAPNRAADTLAWKKWVEEYLRIFTHKSEPTLAKARKELAEKFEVESVKGEKGVWRLGPGLPETAELRDSPTSWTDKPEAEAEKAA